MQICVYIVYTCKGITFYKLWTFPLLNKCIFTHHIWPPWSSPKLCGALPETPMAPVANQGNWIGRWCPSVGSSLGGTEKEWPKLATRTQLMRRWDIYLYVYIHILWLMCDVCENCRMAHKTARQDALSRSPCFNTRFAGYEGSSAVKHYESLDATSAYGFTWTFFSPEPHGLTTQCGWTWAPSKTRGSCDTWKDPP